MPKFIDEIDVVRSNTLSKQKSSPITKPNSASENLMIISVLQVGANNPVNKATRFLEGAVLTITDPHSSVDNTLFPDAEFTKPTTYEKKITKVVNGTNVVMPPYKITRKSDGQTRAVPLNSFDYSITYEKTIVKPNTSGVFKKSYADIQFSNLQTFSGDVYKAKVFTKEKGSQGDYEKIGEVVLDGQNQLINNNGVTGFETIGVYHTQSIITDGWVTSSNLSEATQGEDDLAASVLLSGSNGAHASDFTFITKDSYGLQRGEDYMVSFDTYFNKSNKVDVKGDVLETAEIEVYLTGSAISPTMTSSEYSLGVLDNTFEGMKGRTEGRIDGVFNYFKTHNKAVSLPETKLGFRVKSGNFKLANVSLTPYFEKNFNPVSFRTLLPMPKPVKRGQRFDFYTEFYDFNNNKSNFQAETSASVVFDGAPQVLSDGIGSESALLTGSLFISNVVGSGIELHGGSAYMRSVGYPGFASASNDNLSGFMIFSGSVSQSLPTSESYEGVGLEIVDNSTANPSGSRFLKFRTNAEGVQSEFEVRTDNFLFGIQGVTNNYISGSNGNLEISSSNFALQEDGDVILQGTITAEAGGTIGGFDIGASTISTGTGTNFIALDSTNKKLRIGAKASLTDSNAGVHVSTDGIALGASSVFKVTNAGAVTATSGTVGGWTLGSTLSATNILLDPSTPKITLGSKATLTDSNTGLYLGTDGIALGASSVFKVTSAGAVTAGNITATGGTIGGFTITDSVIESSDFASGVKGVRISTAQNGLIEAENAKIRGTLSTTTFEKETINAVGGQLLIANSTMITGSSMGLNDTSASVANVSGFTVGEVLIVKEVLSTGFNTEYMRVHSASRDSTDDNNLTGKLFVTRSFSNTTSTASGSVGDAIGNSGSYEPGQVIVSTGLSGSGYIRLNANPKDPATPYMDIVERTGSAVYDVELKARLGDLSGLAASKVGTAPGFGLFTEKAFLTEDVTVGTLGTEHITIDGTSIRFIDNTTTMAELRGTTWTLGGAHGATDDAIVMSPTNGVTIYDNSNDYIDITSAGLRVFESGAQVAIFAATTIIGSATDKITLSSGGITIREDSTDVISLVGGDMTLTGGTITIQSDSAGGGNDDRMVIGAGSLAMFANDAKVLDIEDASINIGPAANAGAAVIGNIRLGTGGAFIYGAAVDDYVNVKSDGVDVVAAGVTQAAFGATTVIGTSTDKVTIDGTSGITIKENNVDTIQMVNGVVTVGSSTDNVKIDGTSGITIRENNADTITLVDGTITLKTGTSSHEKLVMSDASIAMFSNNAKLVDITDGKVNIGPAANAGATLGAVVGNIHLAGTGAYIYGDNTNTFAAVTSAGLEVTEDGVKKAIFGAVSVIGSDGAAVTPTSTDDCIRIANGTVSIFQDNTHKATVTSAGLSVFEGSASTPEAIFGSTTTIGQVADDSTRVQIESDTVKIINRDGDSNDTTMLEFGSSGNVSSEGGFILEKTRLFGAGNDGNVVLKSNECTVASGAGSAARASATSILDENGTEVCSRSGTTWTMQGDWYTNALEVDNSVANTTLVTNGYRLFVKGILLIDANCIIHNDGAAGTDGEEGGADASTDGGQGGAGGGESGCSLSPGTVGSVGGRGGNPGTSGTNHGGQGGGGGGSGGIIFISAATITNNGLIRSHGGAGGAGGVGVSDSENPVTAAAAGAAGSVGTIIHIPV